MPFEKFDESGNGRGRPTGADPMISIRKSESIGINEAALEAFFEDADGAVMYYDGDENLVGIEPVDHADADEAAYTITKSESGGTIAPQAFLDKYDLTPDVTTQFDPEWDDEEELVVVDLDEPRKTYGEPEETEVTA